MSSRTFLACLVVAGAAVGAYFALGTSKPVAPENTALPQSPPPAVEKPRNAMIAPPQDAPMQNAPAPTQKPASPNEMIRYPDGSYMPPLNGVKHPAGLQWPPEVPYSPIVGKRLAGEVEWYVHADGTQSTTQMTWRSDLGRLDAITHVARPVAVLPSDSDG